MDNSYGVYVSIRTIDGKLWSSSRETQAEVETDFANATEWLEGHGFLSQQVEVTHQNPNAGHVSDADALNNISSVLGPPEASGGSQGLGTPPAETFEKCRKCNIGTRNQWRPPGISKKTGKPYQGFYSCNNPSCR